MKLVMITLVGLVLSMMSLACTAGQLGKAETGLDRLFHISDDVDSHRETMVIFLAYQSQHPVMRHWSDRLTQSNAPMAKIQFALRPEATNDCKPRTLRDYQEALKKYDPASNLPSIYRWDNLEELRNRIQLVSQLLNGESVDYKAAGLKKCHLGILKEMFASTYAQGRVFAYPFQISSGGSVEAREALDAGVARIVSQFIWENPDGTTSEGLQFLPYALKTNLFDINTFIGK